MPVHIVNLTSTLSIVDDELAMTKEQREAVYAYIDRRLHQDAMDEEALRQTMSVPVTARPHESDRR